MVDQNDTVDTVNKSLSSSFFIKKHKLSCTDKFDAFSMNEEDWTEPTQQTYSATKAILTAADDRAEKAIALQSIKTHHSTFIRNAQPTQWPPKVKKYSDRIKKAFILY